MFLFGIIKFLMNKLSHREKTLDIFNAKTDERTKILDDQLEAGTYHRGYFFRDIVQNAVPKGSLILDYGCGSGRLARLVAEKGYQVIGLDPAVELIRKANEQDGSKLKLQFGLLEDEGESLPQATYNAIICSSAIEFVAEPGKVLRHLYRSLKTTGKLIISFSNPDSLWKYYAKIRFGGTYDHFSVQKTSVNFREAKKLLLEAGFDKVSSPVYFESAMDRYRFLRSLNRFSFVGTLFWLLPAKKKTPDVNRSKTV